MRERDHEANRAMPAHTQISDVIEKNGAADARFVFRLNEQRSDDDIGTARLIHNGGTESVELLLKFFASCGDRAATEVRPARDDNARRLTRRV
jgi:hypothetical protein